MLNTGRANEEGATAVQMEANWRLDKELKDRKV